MSLSKPLDILPVELQLKLVGFLPLTALIMMQGVSKYWKVVIEGSLDRPHVVHPTRYLLFSFWKEVLTQNWFLPSREHILPSIKPFDREKYIKDLPGGIPLSFEMWVREWPSKAVIGWTWPGLDGKLVKLDSPTHWYRICERNLLSVQLIEQEGRRIIKRTFEEGQWDYYSESEPEDESGSESSAKFTYTADTIPINTRPSAKACPGEMGDTALIICPGREEDGTVQTEFDLDGPKAIECMNCWMDFLSWQSSVISIDYDALFNKQTSNS
ncbi:putative f-box domain cyclin-like protein [Neofusicoccum parvum UCRNP2]|uniref:Putative f-box domain cyclin-like protein n=1 Tax=Botryosphaeria parva (strain UCR-NP2) TaxID=1287680 RepID=R1GMR6_BOTPV|nr:putative f-box domain cyclin-like protein [Neofusicoccum parvum UCRNP2]